MTKSESLKDFAYKRIIWQVEIGGCDYGGQIGKFGIKGIYIQSGRLLGLDNLY
jgi:hypothetical protein